MTPAVVGGARDRPARLGPAERAGLSARLLAAVRPEFCVEVFIPAPDDLILQLDELPAAGGAVKAHGYRLDAAASLQHGDHVHHAGDVLLDQHAPEAAAGDRWAPAEAQPRGKALPQRGMAVALKLVAGPIAGLDLEQGHGDPARHQDWGGHRRSAQRAGPVALIGFALLEVGADGRG